MAGVFVAFKPEQAIGEGNSRNPGDGFELSSGIVENLYASTQAISEEDHRHLGASMSHAWSSAISDARPKFDEILGRYYLGASLAQLRRNGS